MIDQLIIGEKASFDDFGASLATRNIGMPRKKSIKETVPFSNVTYDFSKINGEVYWEERDLEFVFEIIASTPEKLEELKTAFSSWVMNVFNEEIHDPFIPDHHFVGTFDDIEFEDDEGLDKTTVTVTFLAYPYKIANTPKVYQLDIDSGTSKKIWIVNESSHRITPTIITHKAQVTCIVTDCIDALFGKILFQNMLHADLAAHGIAVRAAVTVNDNGVKSFDSF